MRETILCDNALVAAEMLRRGQLVAFPTETVYGLGADATNSDSVAGIFESKQRPSFDLTAARQVVVDFPVLAQKLAEKFWPGPLTLVLPKQAHICDLVTAGLPGVGLRIPNHPLAIEVLKAVGRPVAAPSANPFGGISPTTARHVLDGLGGQIDGVLDGGACSIGLESTVVSLMTDQPILLRPGGLPVEDIEAVIGPVHRAVSDPLQDDAAQPAPGLLSRHYAPKTMLQTIAPDDTALPIRNKLCGLLTYGQFPCAQGFEQIQQLSESGDLRRCAANFFARLRSLDSANLDVIIARSFPATGLGIALNDRLRRAASV